MNIFKALAILPQLVGFLTGVFGLVKHVEEIALPGTTGADKRAQAVALVVAALKLAGDLGVPEAAALDPNKVAAVAGTVVDTVVGVLNALGIFKHSAPAADAAPTS